MHHHPPAGRIEIGDFIEGLPLAALGSLALAGVQQRQFVVLAGNGRRNARIHSSTEQNHG